MMTRYLKYLQCFCILFFGCLASSTALATPHNLHDSLQCLHAINFYEKRYKIPQGLLHSIALAESGRWDDNKKVLTPWPWSVNVEGQPYYFNNKREAIEFVESKLAKGIKSIDIGCHQINLHHHGENFFSLEQAFNPVHNARYAAEFLLSHYGETRNWSEAVGRYHSKTQELGAVYKSRVYDIWQKWRVTSPRMMHYTSYKLAIPSSAHNINKISSAKSRLRGYNGSPYQRRGENIIVFSKNLDKRSVVSHRDKNIEKISKRALAMNAKGKAS